MYGDPAQMTSAFYAAVEDWVDKKVTDPNKKVRYIAAVLAELKRDDYFLDPRRFADRNLDLDDREELLNHLREADVQTRSFHKDTERIRSRVKNIVLELEDGTRIITDPERLIENASMDLTSDGFTQINFASALRRTKGRG